MAKFQPQIELKYLFQAQEVHQFLSLDTDLSKSSLYWSLPELTVVSIETFSKTSFVMLFFLASK